MAQTNKQPYTPPALWEWIIAALGLLIALGLLGFLGWEMFSSEPLPPDIRVQVSDVQASGEDYLVLFEAENLGGATAAEVLIQGELRQGARLVETAEVTLAFIPGGSVHEGGLFFQSDPRGKALRLRAQGFTKP